MKMPFTNAGKVALAKVLSRELERGLVEPGVYPAVRQILDDMVAVVQRSDKRAVTDKARIEKLEAECRQLKDDLYFAQSPAPQVPYDGDVPPEEPV